VGPRSERESEYLANLKTVPVLGGLALILVPALAMVDLLARAVLDVPVFDDYDAVLDFLNRFVASDSPAERLRLLFSQHIEHRPALLRAAAVATLAALGHLDLRALQLFGALALALLAAALFASFRPGAPARERILPFAPAALLLFHPQFWSAYLWPSCSATNFFAVALASVAFRALSGQTWRGFALAALAASGATFSQGNGVAALPLGLVALVGPGARARRRAWLAFAALLGAAYVAAFERPFDTWDALANLSDPGRIARAGGYALYFLGSAPAFSQRGLALAAGALLVLSLAALLRRGARRRSPALVALLLFLLASAGLNALVRAQQGMAAPLAQDRYRFYASAFLAATWLAWAAELAATRRFRAVLAGALAAGVAFSSASHALYREKLLDFSRRLEAGLERWWLTGEGGLFYPRFETASRVLLVGFERGVRRVPAAWLAAHGAAPVERRVPEAGAAVKFRLGTLHRDASALLLDGWAHVGGQSRDQRVFVALRSRERTLVFPARSVPRIDLPPDRPQARALARSGFRLLAQASLLPAGAYRIGVLVEREDGAWLSFRADELRVP
jgi:hypothetical protein